MAKNQTTAIVSGEDATYGGLTNEEMRSSLEEAKDAILEKLSKDGFDISNKEWDGWTCINGVRKDGMEYPLVIRSIIRKSKFPQNPKRSVRFSGKGTKRSVQKRKARNTQKAEKKVL